MSAQDELPPKWSMTTRRRDGHWTVLCADGSPVFDPHGSHRGDAARAAWRAYGRNQAEESTMRAAQEFTRFVCELLEKEGSGMDISTDALQDMLTAAGVTP